MSGYDLRMYIGFAVIVFSLVCSLIRFRSLSKEAKVLSIMLVLTLCFEVAAEVSARIYKTNMLVYSIFNIVQFYFISIYFNYSIDAFRPKNIGIWIGGIGVVCGIINYLFIESPLKLESAYLMLEDVLIVGMALYSFYRLLLIDDNIVLTKSPNFWFTSLILFFWTSTFLIWGTFTYLTQLSNMAKSLLLSVLLIVNVITYVGIGLVFLFYKKIQEEHGR